jgi:Fe-S cluster assembly ATP-binding protein
MLEIRDLHASVNGHEVLKGLTLSVGAGEVAAIMGPNGSGKSTLARVVAGHPAYEVTGSVRFAGKDIADLEPEERANRGIFIGFQYPVEVPGVNNAEFLRMAYNAKRRANGAKELGIDEFMRILDAKLKASELDETFKERQLNAGLSGGQKKRNEILQMLVLEPSLAILDETDSGLDIDALKIVAHGIDSFRRQDRAIVLITHYQRLLQLVVPDRVHVLADGVIAKSGDRTLALELEAHGYDWLDKR